MWTMIDTETSSRVTIRIYYSAVLSYQHLSRGEDEAGWWGWLRSDVDKVRESIRSLILHSQILFVYSQLRLKLRLQCEVKRS